MRLTVKIRMKTIKAIITDIRDHRGCRYWMYIFISAARVTSSDDKEGTSDSLIQPGRKAICNAYAHLIIDRDRYSIKVAKAKLDSCGSVSIAHTNLLNDIQPAHKYKLPKIRLRGIGGRTNLLDKVGIIKIKQPDNK